MWMNDSSTIEVVAIIPITKTSSTHLVIAHCDIIVVKIIRHKAYMQCIWFEKNILDIRDNFLTWQVVCDTKLQWASIVWVISSVALCLCYMYFYCHYIHDVPPVNLLGTVHVRDFILISLFGSLPLPKRLFFSSMIEMLLRRLSWPWES